MNNVVNEQISLVLEEMELIGDVYQRADIRVKLISALMGANIEECVDEPEGKEAFKHDKKKVVDEKPVKEEKKKSSKKKEDKKVDKVVEEITEDKPIIFEPATATESEDAITETVEDPQPKEINLEPIVIECEDENGNAYTLDITEAWEAVGDEEGSEERVELARNLTEYNLLPVYNTFNKLDDCYNKMMLAYYMQQYSLEGINEFIEGLTEGMYTDVYEFVNNDNLEGLITNIEEAAQEE